MALRLRRGTDAERLLITPVEGELIYTTDTKLLYAGDGSTAGGTLVAGAGGGGSTTLDALTDTDLTGAVGDDVLTYNSGTNKWEAVAIPGVGVLELSDLSNVNTTGLVSDDLLLYDGLNFVPKTIQEIVGVGGQLSINITGNATGAHAGTLDGDLTGSVFGDDSTLLVDGINNAITADSLNTGLITSPDGLEIRSGNSSTITVRGVTGGATNGAYQNFRTSRGTLEAPVNTQAGDFIGGWNIAGWYDGEYKAAARITTRWDAGATLTVDNPGSAIVLVTNDNSTGFNYAYLDSAGTWVAPTLQTGTHADPTARDAAITTPAAGMIVFLTDSTGASGAAKHQGYDGSSWNDLY